MMFELKDNNFRLGSIILVTSSAFMLVFLVLSMEEDYLF